MNKKEWFDEWFDTPYYHILYKHRDYKEAEDFISNLELALRLRPGDSILDMACGKGRHSIFLNKKGYDVTGVDLSSQSIALAKQYENEQLKFAVHDMREIYAQEKFQYIFNLFTSFGYFENEDENLKAIEAMNTALKQNGTLVLDFLNPDVVIKGLVPEEKKVIDEISFYINREIRDGWIIKNIKLNDQGRDFHFQERVKAIGVEEFLRFFSKSGFTVEQIYGNYELMPYDASSSDRLIFIAKKK